MRKTERQKSLQAGMKVDAIAIIIIIGKRIFAIKIILMGHLPKTSAQWS